MAGLPHLRTNPVIAAVRNTADLDTALASPVRVIFMMGGTLAETPDITRRIHNVGKQVLFHPELVKGLGRDQAGIEYLAEIARPDGIVSTKKQLLHTAANLGLTTVFQIFMIDTQAFVTGLKNIAAIRPDAVEIMPGLMPRVVSQVREKFDLPILTAGLIKTPDEVRALIRAGAAGMAISEQSLWSFTG